MPGTGRKSALVLTYHLRNSKRVGGFHYFIRFLSEEGFDIDWVTIPVSITWLLGKGDRENSKNFLSLTRGFQFEENGSLIRCFTVPILLPAKIAKKLNLKLGDEYWPDWNKLKKQLRMHYDVILFEGVACQYAKAIKEDYKTARLIYRPSDVLATFSSVSSPEKREIEAIDYSDLCVCVDENMIDYYRHIGADYEKLRILRNPLASGEDISHLCNFKPPELVSKKAVYLGVSFCDFDLIEYAANNNPDCVFYIIGPFDRKSHDNVLYTGSMTKEEYEGILSEANVALAPTLTSRYKLENGIKYGFTGKIIAYMKFLLPIVATCSSNYLGVNGFNCVDTKEEFCSKVSDCLKYTINEREELREGYKKTMTVFTEMESKEIFIRYIYGD